MEESFKGYCGIYDRCLKPTTKPIVTDNLFDLADDLNISMTRVG